MAWSNITLSCFLASYVLALLLELSQFLHGSRVVRWGAIALSVAGLVAHTAYLIVRSNDTQLPPLLSSTHDWLLVLSWLAIVMQLSVQMWDRDLAVGLFVLPAAIILVTAAQYSSRAVDPASGVDYWWRMFHASTLVMGMAGVLVCAIISGMYLVQHRRLKSKRIEPKELHLFSLERLSRWNWWAIVLSVPLLTLGMATGLFLVIRSRATEDPVSLFATGFIISGLMWLGMVVLFGWIVTARHPSGKIVAWRTMWACGFLLITLIVLQMFTPGGIHGTASAERDVSPDGAILSQATQTRKVLLP